MWSSTSSELGVKKKRAPLQSRRPLATVGSSLTLAKIENENRVSAPMCDSHDDFDAS